MSANAYWPSLVGHRSLGHVSTLGRGCWDHPHLNHLGWEWMGSGSPRGAWRKGEDYEQTKSVCVHYPTLHEERDGVQSWAPLYSQRLVQTRLRKDLLYEYDLFCLYGRVPGPICMSQKVKESRTNKQINGKAYRGWFRLTRIWPTIFNKGTKVTQWGKKFYFSTNVAGTIGYSY